MHCERAILLKLRNYLGLLSGSCILIALLFNMEYLYVVYRFDTQGHPWFQSISTFNLLGDTQANMNSLNSSQGKRVTSLIDIDSTNKHTHTQLSPRGIHTVLFYNKPDSIKLQSLKGYANDSQCRYNNCRFIDDLRLFNTSSAVIFKLSEDMPLLSPLKHVGQIWVFFDTETPAYNSYLHYRHRSWRSMMNWSMTYRLDSDIIIPYGTLKSVQDIPQRDYRGILSKKTKFAAWIVSHCGALSGRDQYVQDLKKYIPVDVYGKCGRPLSQDWQFELSQYKFYLSFENAFCTDYITEKFFQYYKLDMVVVVRGGADYDSLLPNDTFINTAHFSSAAKLAQFLTHLSTDESAYMSYLRNRDRYVVTGSNGWCDLCTKINNPDQHRRIYTDLVSYWNNGSCWIPTHVRFNFLQYVQEGWVLVVSIALFMLGCLFFCIYKRKT